MNKPENGKISKLIKQTGYFCIKIVPAAFISNGVAEWIELPVLSSINQKETQVFLLLCMAAAHFLEYCLQYYSHQNREVKIATEGESQNNLEQGKC